MTFGISNVEGVSIPSGHTAQTGTGMVELVDVEIGTVGIDTINDGSGGINLIVDLPLLANTPVTLEAVSVYPNPAVDIINLQMPSVLTVN